MEAPSRAGAMALLPPSVRVVVRGWLNCNQVVLRAPGANVLVDSGYCTHAGNDAAPGRRGARRRSPGARSSTRIATRTTWAATRRSRANYGCAITIPAGEVKHIVAVDAAKRVDGAVRPAARSRSPSTTRSPPGQSFAAGGLRLGGSRRAGARHGRADVLRSAPPHPHFGRRAVGERAWASSGREEGGQSPRRGGARRRWPPIERAGAAPS